MSHNVEFIVERPIFSKISEVFLKDKRDKPFLFLTLRSLFIHLPIALYIYMTPTVSYWVILPYMAMLIFFLGPHLLMLHNICHRNPWKKEVKTAMNSIVSLLGLLYGLPMLIYYHHHIKMHHYEENGPKDLSSTEKFKRNSFFYWMAYFARFVLLNAIELPYYFIKQKRYDFALKSFIGWTSFYTIVYLSYLYNPKGTMIIFFIPTAFCWFGLMGGNWAQHAFLDKDESDNPYKSSITVVDSLYNKRCFNDGYHIGHHKYPGMHWTEMPNEFDKNRDEYYENKAIIFRTLDYQVIWFLLMLKQYKFLAKFYVPKNPGDQSIDEIADLIKQRTSFTIGG